MYGVKGLTWVNAPNFLQLKGKTELQLSTGGRKNIPPDNVKASYEPGPLNP